jgi:hypothetical protein
MMLDHTTHDEETPFPDHAITIAIMRSKMTKPPITLLSFKVWLAREGKSPRTVQNYAGHIRAVLHTPEEAIVLLSDPDRAREVFTQADRALPRSSRHVFRAAVRALDAFLKFQKQVTFEPVFLGDESKIDPFANHPLTPLLRRLTEDSQPTLPLHRIPNLKWKHVQKHWTRGGLGILDPVWGRMFEIPRDLLIDINKWVTGNETPLMTGPILELPFIPREPLSQIPMPSAMLRKLACM